MEKCLQFIEKKYILIDNLDSNSQNFGFIEKHHHFRESYFNLIDNRDSNSQSIWFHGKIPPVHRKLIYLD